YREYQPWRAGSYNDLIQRLYRGAAAGDKDAVAACLDSRATPIVQDKSAEPAIQYGGAQLTKTISFKELAARGPLQVRRLEPQYLEPGGVLIHTVDRSGKPLGFLVRHRDGRTLKIVY